MVQEMGEPGGAKNKMTMYLDGGKMRVDQTMADGRSMLIIFDGRQASDVDGSPGIGSVHGNDGCLDTANEPANGGRPAADTAGDGQHAAASNGP